MAEDKSKEVDSNVFTFSHLPEIIGTGELYQVSVQTVVNIAGKNYHSETLSDIFATKPLPPEKLTVVDAAEQIFSWMRSPSPSVHNYKLKIKKDIERDVFDAPKTTKIALRRNQTKVSGEKPSIIS